MNIKKIRKQLKKVNTLFKAIEEEGSANKIEKDLLKNYILTLYEQVIDSKDNKETDPDPIPVKAKEKKASIHKYSESIFNTEKEEAVIEKDPIETIVEKEFKTANNGSSVSSHSIEAVMDLEEKVQEEIEATPEVVEEMDERMDLIFQDDASNDLSSRLSRTPIANLNNAFGINEKVFNINELFKGDHGMYQKVINQLNTFTTPAEAKQYLYDEVVQKYGWLEDHMIKKAAHFSKVIQRRYL